MPAGNLMVAVVDHDLDLARKAAFHCLSSVD
jgi:hypothetical protein